MTLVHASNTGTPSVWQLLVTPSLSLSLVVEAERPEPSIIRSLSRLALLCRPSLLREALDRELAQDRTGPGASQQAAHGHVISATTLRVVDAAYHRLQEYPVSHRTPTTWN